MTSRKTHLFGIDEEPHPCGFRMCDERADEKQDDK
jgi:hypothetical protein